MKKLIFLIYILPVLLGSCAKSTLPLETAKWANNWPDGSEPSQFDSISKVYYEVQRDDNNIYLHFKTNELATQMKILRYGLSIYFDAKAGKKENVGFTFPLAVADTAMNNMGNRGEGRPNGERGERPSGPPSPEQMQRRILERVYKRYTERTKEISLKGFEGLTKKQLILGKDPSFVQVDLELGENNTLNYYAVIPINKITVKNSNFSIGFKTGYMSMDEDSGHQMGGFGGGRTNSGGSDRPQMSEEDRAKRREMMMKMMQDMSTASEFWFKVDLSAKK